MNNSTKIKKFRKVAGLVAITEKIKNSSKKDKFEQIKNKVKQRKSSIAPGGGNGGLNSKYEEELKMEQDMQEMYNAR